MWDIIYLGVIGRALSQIDLEKLRVPPVVSDKELRTLILRIISTLDVDPLVDRDVVSLTLDNNHCCVCILFIAYAAPNGDVPARVFRPSLSWNRELFGHLF